jgi:nucleoside-diphosphate-sugar epimerase
VKILLTGGTGFVGSHLLSRLLSDRHDVAVVVRAESQFVVPSGFEKQATILRTDGTLDSLASGVKEFSPELCYHLAAKFVAEHTSADVDDLAQSNLSFGLQILEALSVAGCRKLVSAGTSWQNFGGDAYEPVCLYAATKEAFEALAQYYVSARGVSLSVLKLFDTYGPKDPRRKVLSLLLRVGKSGEHLSMSGGEQLLDLVYISDVIDAFVETGARLCDGRDSGKTTYAVSAGKRLSLRKLAEEVSTITGRPLNIEWGRRPYREREVMIPWSGGRPVPGWQPRVSLSEGLTRLLAEDV